MALILRYTPFENPLPNLVALTSQIYTVWENGLKTISDAGNIEPSEFEAGKLTQPEVIRPRDGQ